MFHLAISNMAQRHVAICERHVALQVRHVALQVRHAALLMSRQLSASLNYCYVIFNPPRPLSQWKHPDHWCLALTPMTQYLITAGVQSVCTLNWGGWVLKMPKRVNWMPGGHDKVPPMIGGTMSLLNPKWNTDEAVRLFTYFIFHSQ